MRSKLVWEYESCVTARLSSDEAYPCKDNRVSVKKELNYDQRHHCRGSSPDRSLGLEYGSGAPIAQFPRWVALSALQITVFHNCAFSLRFIHLAGPAKLEQQIGDHGDVEEQDD